MLNPQYIQMQRQNGQKNANKFRVSIRIPTNQKFLVMVDLNRHQGSITNFIRQKIVQPFCLDPDDFGSDDSDAYLLKELTGVKVICLEELIKDD